MANKKKREDILTIIQNAIVQAAADASVATPNVTPATMGFRVRGGPYGLCTSRWSFQAGTGSTG
jgi:hypothetical protein